jgi:hypothetical protein
MVYSVNMWRSALKKNWQSEVLFSKLFFVLFLKDAQFESDERITPLESALTIWASIEKEHDKLHEEIQNLIKIQVWLLFCAYSYFTRKCKRLTSKRN